MKHSKKIVLNKSSEKGKKGTKSPLVIGLVFSFLVLVAIIGSFAIERTIHKETKEAEVNAVASENITQDGTVIADKDDDSNDNDNDNENENENADETKETQSTEKESELQSQVETTESQTEEEKETESTTTEQSSTSDNTKKGQGEYEGVKKVYLTFDDGPSSITSQILDVLDCYGVKATFFTVCHTNDDAIENMQRIVNEGHTIAIHSLTHSYSQVYASVDAFKEDVLGMQQFIYDNTGYKTFLYRFPGGSSNTIAKCDIGECIDFLDDAGFEYFDWNVESGDATANMLDKDIIVENVLSSLGDNEEYVVLMHDAEPKKTTLEALPEIIEGIQSRGYEILPITENTKPVHHRRKNKSCE